MKAVGHGLQDLRWHAIGARGFAPGHASEASAIFLLVELAIEHGGGERGGGREVVDPRERGIGVDVEGRGQGGSGLCCDCADDLPGVIKKSAPVSADGSEGGAGGTRSVGFAALKEFNDKSGFLDKEACDGAGIILGAKCGGLVYEAFCEELVRSEAALKGEERVRSVGRKGGGEVGRCDVKVVEGRWGGKGECGVKYGGGVCSMERVDEVSGMGSSAAEGG